jgi:hypothetical protein
MLTSLQRQQHVQAYLHLHVLALDPTAAPEHLLHLARHTVSPQMLSREAPGCIVAESFS